MIRVLTLLFILTSSFFSHAMTVMSLNTEWFWDGQLPHEGQIAMGPAGSPPSPKQVELEAFAIAQIIKNKDAKIVALSEIENITVAEKITHYLGPEWKVIFSKGRDHYTGQDVAILTTFSVIKGSISNLKGTKGIYQSTEATPSKALSVGLESNGISYLVTAAHLISKKSGNNLKRAAQANSISRHINAHKHNYDHYIVLGDLNDTPNSETLLQLQSTGLKQISSPSDFSYIYRGKKQLIDHILVSQGLSTNAKFGNIFMGPISDHYGVYAEL
ncbi:endonuclease/exonuclease/phosphatase family protein [Pseudoalteromonas luteoviolacea]|uniref:endonuclease/exonuclease/phosphatase family protein n=1 Tax=Pseudoalteromonas luteoviolacea TaxID=43657 RepID=UPI001F3AF534|nr:endonuclease/exonuclease/phosphatase family protein [Pseudoalteromonas luteoviolacea]MCF6441051.1 endonuclease/exonuclease/phosphatase family protein [Pseudoalteromonas luteoviolacea]